jgi:hypothetical protein
MNKNDKNMKTIERRVTFTLDEMMEERSIKKSTSDDTLNIKPKKVETINSSTSVFDFNFFKKKSNNNNNNNNNEIKLKVLDENDNNSNNKKKKNFYLFELLNFKKENNDKNISNIIFKSFRYKCSFIRIIQYWKDKLNENSFIKKVFRRRNKTNTKHIKRKY